MNKLALTLSLLCSTAFAQEVWAPSTIPVVNPSDYGANHNCSADDRAGIDAAIAALPGTGGIVLFSTTCTRHDTKIAITKPHVKLWCNHPPCTLLGQTNDVDRTQAVVFSADGGGVHGLTLASNATVRKTALEDHQIVFDHTTGNEVVGVEISGSQAAGVYAQGANVSYVEGNYVHDTWADHIHFTDSSRTIAVWGNHTANDASLVVQHGDDGIACVTVGPTTSPKTGDMEVWANTLHPTRWGRGLSAVGCDSFNFHDNFITGAAGAGIYIASEPSYNTAAPSDGTVTANTIVGCGHTIGHQGILVYSGNSALAGNITNIALSGNTAYGTPAGAYVVSGPVTNVTAPTSAWGSATEPGGGTPPLLPIARKNTLVLLMRDTSFVAASFRPGLYRVHVRQKTVGAGSELRYEYVVKGDPGRVAAWAERQVAAGGYVSEKRTVSGVGYALALTPAPALLTPWAGLSGVTWAELRSTALAWLWTRVDSGNY